MQPIDPPRDLPATVYAVALVWQIPEGYGVGSRIVCVSGINPLTTQDVITRAKAMNEPNANYLDACVSWVSFSR